MRHHPKNYDLPTHLAKIAGSTPFDAAMADLAGDGKPITSGDLHAAIGVELKRIVASNATDELAQFEQAMGPLAIQAAVSKLKAQPQGPL